ncbi:unnamed protein product [Arabidopsis thaliana]|uniref:(thale cress) hypothetical protein n=1 Tax=Arabidopsis thaliana TaxID=3702 RepID=A0A7G2EK33_ARATH|nr:unnamed protein product [Arabidopsis thaliana]
MLFLRRIAVVFFVFTSFSAAQNSTCPLDFSVLEPFRRPKPDGATTCQYLLQGLRLLYSHHLRQTGSFLPPPESAASCWAALQSSVAGFLPRFDVRSTCGFQTPWISQGCMDITTRSQFESLIPNSSLATTAMRCNTSLESNTPCASCTQSLSAFQPYLSGPSLGNVSDCASFPSIYAAAFANSLGPTDKGTAKCLFQLDLASPTSSGANKVKVLVSSFSVLLVASVLVITAWFWYCRRKKSKLLKPRDTSLEAGTQSRLDSMSESTTLVKFSFDEIKKATNNFSRHNIIGRGGYGNVFKGALPDGTQVAFKRFKNCSAGGDANFAHEVEVIASIRHVNLLALRGYCTATTPYEGHQRIIVCDLVSNDEEGQPVSVADWAWSLVREGQTLDVVEDGMPEKGPPEVLEKYVLIAVLCSHPQLHARPTMDQVVKMLESNEFTVIAIPQRPIPLVACREEIDRSVSSSSGSGKLTSPTGYQAFSFGGDGPSGNTNTT